MKLNKLYSRSTTGKICTWEIEISQNKYRTISGFEGMKMTTSDWTVCEVKTYCSAEEQTIKEATAIHRKKMEKGSFENIKDIDDETYFEPMLANKWEDYKVKVKYPIYSQPKLDGIRCIVKKDGMWSRNGKHIISAPHIFEILKPLFEINPDLIFDGELYADKFANDFNAICSLVKKTKPTSDDLKESAEKIQYHIYDLPSYNATFVYRYQHLKKLITNYNTSIVLVNTDQVDNINDLLAYHEDYVSYGYEGQMLRLDLPYENKRSKSLLKHKSFVDSEFVIKGYEEGIGKLSDKVGNLKFEINGKPFNAAVNGTHKHLSELWIKRNELVGQTATIKYFELTSDGIPRFPKVININRNSYE